MFKFLLSPDIKARAAGFAARFPPFAGAASRLRGARIAPILGWTAVVLVGAAMMAHAARDNPHAAPSTAAPAAVAAAPAPSVAEAPKADPAPAPNSDLAALVATPAPAPSPAAAKTKSTQRIDMTPTGAISGDAPAKPHHKPHKKKPKDVDASQ